MKTETDKQIYVDSSIQKHSDTSILDTSIQKTSQKTMHIWEILRQCVSSLKYNQSIGEYPKTKELRVQDTETTKLMQSR